MVLSIKDPETDRLARNLARLTGESLTDTVKAALRERLAREQRRRGKQLDRSKLDAIVARIAALPVVDDRSPDELIGYDEFGLPTRCSRSPGMSPSGAASKTPSMPNRCG